MAGAGWARFFVIDFAISEGTANWAESDNVVRCVLHVGEHGREEGEVSDSVIIVVGFAWLGAVALR